jgi:hypothetical protein
MFLRVRVIGKAGIVMEGMKAVGVSRGFRQR